MSEPEFPFDENGDEFMTYLGMCITQWAHLEEEIFKIMQEILWIRTDLISIIFYSAPTLEIRLTLCDELLGAVFPKPKRKSGGHKHPDAKRWEGFLKLIREETPTSNRLAHSPVRALFRSGLNWLVAISQGEPLAYESYTPHQKLFRKRHADDKPLSLGALKVHLTNVKVLTNRLEAFQATVRVHASKSLRPQPLQDPDSDQ